MSKQLRKEIYKSAYELSEKFPEKPSLEAGSDEGITYTKNLLQALEKGIADCENQKIQEIAKKMNELPENEQIREIRSKDDKDARFGHKTAASTFYGYKNHIAMTEERLIAGISVTHGGAPDGPELPGLIEKAQKNGNTYLRYVFSKVKCRKCPLRENCHVGKSTSEVRSYSITQVSQKNQERLEFESSEMFRERLKIRHRIEEKNGSFSVSFYTSVFAQKINLSPEPDNLFSVF